MVVVMPSLAHGKQTDEKVITAGICGDKLTPPIGMTDRIHCPCNMMIKEDSDGTTPEKTTQATH